MTEGTYLGATVQQRFDHIDDLEALEFCVSNMKQAF